MVFGWDSSDVTYDNAELTGWQHGFPDALARLDLDTHRNVPWDGGVPFFLGEFVNADGRPSPICPRQTLEARARSAPRSSASRRCAGMEFEWFNFAETPQSWAAKKGVGPEPITPGMFGYSLLRMNHKREYFNALMDEMPAFGVPIEGLHTETGPGVYEVAILFGEALEQGRPRDPVQDRRQGDRRALRHHAELHGQVEPAVSGLQRPHPPEPVPDGKTNLFYDAKSPRKMSKLFESYLAGQVACLMEFAPMFWPTINSYKRLVDGFWAPVKPTWGMDNRTASFRVIAGSPKATRLETRCPGADVNPYLAMAAVIAAGLHGVEKGLKLTAPPITGTNQGSENIPRAPRTLIETTRIFKQSEIARDWLGDDFVDHFAATRDWEWRQWLDGVTDWELKRYFEIICFFFFPSPFGGPWGVFPPPPARAGGGAPRLRAFFPEAGDPSASASFLPRASRTRSTSRCSIATSSSGSSPALRSRGRR